MGVLADLATALAQVAGNAKGSADDLGLRLRFDWRFRTQRLTAEVEITVVQAFGYSAAFRVSIAGRFADSERAAHCLKTLTGARNSSSVKSTNCVSRNATSPICSARHVADSYLTSSPPRNAMSLI